MDQTLRFLVVLIIGCSVYAQYSYKFCSKGPHGNYDCSGCTGQCRERESDYGCANPVGNDGVHGCYCNTQNLFSNETKTCEANGVHGAETCNIPTDGTCPPLKGPNGTCAIGIVTSNDMHNCTDCYNIGGKHNFHFACWNSKTKQCHVTENECKTHSPPCGTIPGWCPCPEGWQTCYNTLM